MVKRAGLPLAEEPTKKELGKTDAEKRKQEAEVRKKWEETRTAETGNRISNNVGGRSALSRRSTLEDGKPDIFLSDMDRRLDPQSFSEDKTNLEKMMKENNNRHEEIAEARAANANLVSATKMSEIVARAGAGDAFEGEKIGIGGLDDVLAQVKRRVWTPLAAPPQLLEELGIHPVRGLLLYGRPGCVSGNDAGELLSMLNQAQNGIHLFCTGENTDC